MKSVCKTIKRNNTITDNKNATTWFLVCEEKYIEIAINEAPIQIVPIYPTIVSGIYNPLKKDKETGRLTVKTKLTIRRVTNAKNFEKTI
jgi:hypothetical protein